MTVADLSPDQNDDSLYGGNFTLANNLNQPITTKYPNDKVSIVLRDLAADMVTTARLLRSVDSP